MFVAVAIFNLEDREYCGGKMFHGDKDSIAEQIKSWLENKFKCPVNQVWWDNIVAFVCDEDFNFEKYFWERFQG